MELSFGYLYVALVHLLHLEDHLADAFLEIL